MLHEEWGLGICYRGKWIWEIAINGPGRLIEKQHVAEGRYPSNNRYGRFSFSIFYAKLRFNFQFSTVLNGRESNSSSIARKPFSTTTSISYLLLFSFLFNFVRNFESIVFQITCFSTKKKKRCDVIEDLDAYFDVLIFFISSYYDA